MLGTIVIFSICICVVGVKFLKLLDSPSKPKVYHSESHFIKNVLSRCKQLMQVYHPPLLWGKSGHIQTAIYGKFGRWNCPHPSGKRHMITMDSGETVSYDKFEASRDNRFKTCCTLLVCPGICNSSEKKYIRTFIQFTIDKGYNVYVLNHIGVLPSVKLTSPKIFTYGETKYFAKMVEEAQTQNPMSLFIVVGFSMGGNIVAKYLGEDVKRQDTVLCAVSMCQGYDGIRSTIPMSYGYRRFYNYMLTKNFLSVLQPHWKDLFHLHEDHVHSSSSKLFDEKKVKSATCLKDIEDGLLRHFGGHASTREYMRQCGCDRVIHNINLPIMFLNSEDDPLIVSDVHDIPLQFSQQTDNALFVTTKHGGHLGFFKGGWYRPDDITMVEIYVLEFVEAVLDITINDKLSTH